ncbi:unnamed protein product [marine sediment metagenome]|uniref:Uncharacterized protein n=1 Tax=marine sediment metagenome TaxID=412755 RepID=X0RN12_9ZZZZ
MATLRPVLPQEWCEAHAPRVVSYDLEALIKHKILVPVLTDTGDSLDHVFKTSLTFTPGDIAIFNVSFYLTEPYKKE